MFCTKKDHQKIYKFCLECASKKKPVDEVFFCNRCNLKIKERHEAHSAKVNLISDSSFMQPLKSIKDILNQKMRQYKESEINLDKIQGVKEIEFNCLLQNDNNVQKIISDKQFMEWLIKIQFLQISKKDGLQKIKSNIRQHLDKIIKSQGNLQQNRIYNRNQLKIQLENTPINNLDHDLANLKSSIQISTKQQNILNFFFILFSSFSVQDCYNAEIKCDGLLKKYGDMKILYLGKIRICQLLPNKHKDITKNLNKILSFDPQFKKSDLYYYYQAMSFWQMTEAPDQSNQFTKIFFQLKNKRYYRLNNCDQYINSLKIAISINPKPVYYSSLGIGYLVKKQYRQAIQSFEKATQYDNDSVDLNKIWVQIQNQQYIDFDSIIKTIGTRTMQFIVNLCRYFKNSKQFKNLVQCCQVLVQKQPSNEKLQIQFVKSIISFSGLNDIQFDQNDQNRLIQAERIIAELKKAKNKQAHKLQKRYFRMKAKQELTKQQRLQKSRQTFYQVTTLSNASSSDFYNYACCLFMIYLRDNNDDLLKQSQKMINNAIKMKQKNKYLKLKFFILSYMNEFNLASDILEKKIKSDIDQKAYGQLIEFINDNKD